MKKRIFKNIVLLSSAVLIISTAIMMIIYFTFFSKQVEAQVAHEAQIITEAINSMTKQEEVSYLDEFKNDETLRVAIINPEGDVIYDTKEIENPEKHNDRPEVLQAFKKGAGSDSRYSKTHGIKAYYHAIRMENGNVLRVSYYTDATKQLFVSILPVVLIILIISLFICIMAAGGITKSIIKPINNMDLQHPTLDSVYDELRPLMIRIRRQNDERSKNEKMRQEFSANVSHELKTPLTSISGYAELLESGMVSDKDVINFAHKIHHESKRMTNLVNDIIKISRLDEHRVGVEKEPVDLLRKALDVKDRLELVAKNNKVTISVIGKPIVTNAVEQMMDELLYNLCENAIKYNRSGGFVHISIGQEDGKARIEISDNGIGIPEDSQERIFERFYRVDKSHSRQTGGTGLGLAIVKHIVEYHGGMIRLHSVLGKGTSIIILL